MRNHAAVLDTGHASAKYDPAALIVAAVLTAIGPLPRDSMRTLRLTVRGCWNDPFATWIRLPGAHPKADRPAALWFRPMPGATVPLLRQGLMLSVSPGGAIVVRASTAADGRYGLAQLLMAPRDPLVIDSVLPQWVLHWSEQLLARLEAVGLVDAVQRPNVLEAVDDACLQIARDLTFEWSCALDPAALRTALRLEQLEGVDGVAAYNRLASHDPTASAQDPAGRAIRIRNRVQFADSCSVLSELWLLDRPAQDVDGIHEWLTRAIDQGASLRDMLPTRWPKVRSVLSWLLRPRPRWLRLALAEQPDSDEVLPMTLATLPSLTEVLAQLPPSYWPSDRAGFNQCRRLVAEDAAALGTLWRELGVTLFPLLQVALRDHRWSGLQQAEDRHGRALLSRVRDAIDAVGIVQDVVESGLRNTMPDASDETRTMRARELIAAWLNDRPLSSILRFSDAVHEAHAAAQQEAIDSLRLNARSQDGLQLSRRDERWPSVMTPGLVPDEIDDVQFEEILTPDDLILEGATMRHCVARHMRECRKGFARIFRLRAGNERATLMVRTVAWPFRLDELRGPRNQRSSELVQRASTQFVCLLNATTPPKLQVQVSVRLSTGVAGSLTTDVLRAEFTEAVNLRLDPRLRAMLPEGVRGGSLATSLINSENGLQGLR